MFEHLPIGKSVVNQYLPVLDNRDGHQQRQGL